MFCVTYPHLLYEDIRQYIPTHVWFCYNLCKACWNWSPFSSWEWSFLLVRSPSPVSLAGNTQLKLSQGSEVTSFSLAAAGESEGWSWAVVTDRKEIIMYPQYLYNIINFSKEFFSLLYFKGCLQITGKSFKCLKGIEIPLPTQNPKQCILVSKIFWTHKQAWYQLIG